MPEPQNPPPPPGAIPVADFQAPPPPEGAIPVEAPQAPAGAVAAPDEAPGVGQRMVERFMGTDVEDPLELTRMTSIMAGATIGAIAGSKVPTLPGPAGLVINPITGTLVFGGLGAIAGAAFPEGTLELGEAIGVLPTGTRKEAGLSPEDLRTVAEGEALLELATGGGFTALRTVGRVTSRVLTGTTKAGVAAAEAAARQNIALMPVQVGNGIIARGYVAVMGRFPWIGSAIVKRGQAAEDALQKAITSAPARVAPIAGWSEISEAIFKDAGEFMSFTSTRFRKLYDDVFERADELGVSVIPQATIDKANEVMQKLAARTPITAAEAVGGRAAEGKPGAALVAVQEFIKDEILPLSATLETGVRVTAKQSLKMMDGLISKIDQKIASLEPSERRFAASLFKQIRQAAQLDMVTNVRGMNGGEITRALKAIDQDFSHTMSEIFETATAKKFGSVKRGGLRSVGFDKATRIPVDQLARMVVKLDSPQAMRELSRLVTPETFQRITAKVMDDAVQGAMSGAGGGSVLFDLEKFAKHLGLDAATANKRKAISEMLEASGSPFKIKDLEELIETARTISSVEIPNVSTFLARKATIGGLRGLINGLVPGLALAGGATGAAALGGPILGMAVFLGGGKLVSAIISNPDSARALMSVIGKEASRLRGREAMIRALRLGMATLKEQEIITDERHDQLSRIAAALVDAFDRQMEDLAD